MAIRLPRRPICLAVCAAACLASAALYASAQSAGSASTEMWTSRAGASRFLAKRGNLGGQPAYQLVQARRARAAMLQASAGHPLDTPSALNQPWQPLGPAQVSTAAFGSVTGRVTSIAADPSDTTGNTVYLGTTGGGVWKSTNAAGSASAVSFAPLTDDLPAFSSGAVASLSVGAISVQPGGMGVVLAGTGDPNDALDSYYGSGILRSTDNGLTWSLISESNDFDVNGLTNFHFFGLAFAGFAWSTQNPQLVVAAVSQSAEGVLVGANQKESAPGIPGSVMGLYYSTDAGQTWLLATITDGPGQVIQTTSTPSLSGGNAVTALVWNPMRQRFYAAVRFHGYYESLDGITFTRLVNQPGSALTTTECPTEPGSVGSPACPIFRGALAVQPESGDMFALTVDINLLDQGLWQDVCSAASGACASSTVTFGQQLSTASLDDGQGAITTGDYNLWLAAFPSGGDTILFAGTEDIFRCSLAAGCAMRNTTNTGSCAAAGVAPFQHAVDSTFAAGLSLMYFGNDSGLWRSTDDVDQTQPPCSRDDANHFQNLNGGLGSLAEVLTFAQDPSNSGILLVGLGVNGTAAATASGQALWPQVLDGYGSYVAIDPANSQNWYAQSNAGVAIDLCPNGSLCNPAGFAPAIGYAQVSSDAYAFSEPSPFLLDPQGSTDLILGTCHIWRGPADGLSWSAANLLGALYPGEGQDCTDNAFVQALAATGTISSPAGNVELIYAGMAGIGVYGPQAFAGHLFEAAVSDAAPVPSGWTDLWLSPVVNDPNGFNPYDYSISSVTTDPHDATGQTVYVTIEAFDTHIALTGTLYATTNGGASWTNIRSNLPGDPVNSIAIDTNDANTVYVAMDTGVYVTTSVTSCLTQNCWSVYGTGLPNSPVIQLATFNSGGQSLLRAGTYGRGIWQIPLVTAQAAFTTSTVAPTALTFAPQPMQTQSAAQAVTITNTGSIAMTVSSASVNGDFSVANNCAAAVPVGGNCTVQVTFTPTATGARSGTLVLYVNVAGGQITVPLTGTGIPGATIVLLPTSLSFGSSMIGVSTTPAQNVTISNTGGVVANLQTPVVTGDFSIVANTCFTTLAPQFGCTVALTFTPTASGSRTGVFSITDSVGTQTATLSGTGISPATDTISPAALSFGPQVVGTTSANQSVTLTNSGDSPLNSIAVAITGDFQAVDGCGNSLIGHATCSITVSYVPEQVGPETGTLTITDAYGKPQTVGLSGTGVAPAGISALPTAIDFGPWGVGGTSPAQSVTLTDTGGVPLDGLTFAMTGNFSVATNSCSSTLPVGSNCSMQVVFAPTQPGPFSGTLTITSSSLSSPIQIPLSGSGLGFTFQAEGENSATIASGQTATYLLQVLPDTGSSGTLTFTCADLPANSTCTVNPTSLQMNSGVTGTVTVTIATVAATSSARSERSFPGPYLVASLPGGVCLLIIPWLRRKGLSRGRFLLLCVSALISLLQMGCGVQASGGTSTTPTSGNPTSTPPATYNPVITAAGPGISQSVTLTLIVD